MVSDVEKPTTSMLEQRTSTPVESAVDQKPDRVVPAAIDKETEKRLLRKMDIRLIPMLTLLYLLAFLDRGNIGNAKIEGMLEDLHMTSKQYSMACMFIICHERIDVAKNGK